ncbi:MoaD/ThiS family protein [Herbiconiux sp. 11R-BC]|uniref:MoaD/ThiS family protein n=1 Tax=Herbiconiux sp. 11R-BC TaxID=3111637 RepID=UPI003BFE11B2
MQRIRYFAAAKAALGVGEEIREAAGLTIGEFLAERAAEAPDAPAAAAVLARCSFILNRAATTDRATRLADGDSLDVLPPFAGG